MNPVENTNQEKRNASDLDSERGPMAANTSKKQREDFFASSAPQAQASIRDCIFDEGVDSGAPCAVPLAVADDFFANSAVIYGSFMEGNSSFAKLLNTADTQELAVGSVFLVFATRWEIVFFQVQELRTVARMRVYKMNSVSQGDSTTVYHISRESLSN